MSEYVQVPCVVCGTLFWRPANGSTYQRQTCGAEACRVARISEAQRRRWARKREAAR